MNDKDFTYYLLFPNEYEKSYKSEFDRKNFYNYIVNYYRELSSQAYLEIMKDLIYWYKLSIKTAKVFLVLLIISMSSLIFHFNNIFHIMSILFIVNYIVYAGIQIVIYFVEKKSNKQYWDCIVRLSSKMLYTLDNFKLIDKNGKFTYN